MTITFVLPMAGIAGGVKVVYEYANRLQERGHKVNLVVPRKMFPENEKSLKWRLEAKARQVKYAVDAARGKSEATWFPLRVPLVRTPSLEERYIPDADVIIATYFETAECVAKLPDRCGQQFYFIQGYEIWDGDVERVHATWKLPLKKFVVAPFLEQIGRDLKEKIYAVIPNGVDPDVFYNKHKEYHQPRRVLMLSHHQEIKGIPDGFEAIAIARKTVPDLEFAMFGAEPPREDMPEGTTYVQQPTPAALRELYSSADIFVSPSWSEGWGLPAMEAMACKTAVVATNVGGIPLYADAGTTALVVEPKQPKKLAEAIVSLAQDAAFLKKISEGGYAKIQQFTWDKSTDALEKLLTDAYKERT